MNNFQQFIAIMTYVSLAFMAIEIYLTLNKLWKRKHERVVAESISISAKFFSLGPLLIFTLNFLFKGEMAGLISNLMLIFFIFVQIAIGAGTWVAEERNKNFFSLLKQALRLESKEVGDLANALFHPHNADKILKVISLVAIADGYLDEKERSFVQSFADSWNLEIDFQQLEKQTDTTKTNLNSVRQAMLDFLNESPPKEQASQLIDVLNLLVKIDGNVSDKEQMMLEELTGLVNRYIAGNGNAVALFVAVVPQTPEQEKAIVNLIPKLSKKSIAGGLAYVTGPFFSDKYAQLVCEEYRAFDFFSVTVLVENSFENN